MSDGYPDDDEYPGEDEDALAMMDEMMHGAVSAPVQPVAGRGKRPLFDAPNRSGAGSGAAAQRGRTPSGSEPRAKKARAAVRAPRVVSASDLIAAAAKREAAKVHLVPRDGADATTCTLPSGQRVFLDSTAAATSRAAAGAAASAAVRRAGTSLLKVPLAELNREVDRLMQAEIESTMQRASALVAGEDDDAEEAAADEAAAAALGVAGASVGPKNGLWVDKYRPSRFTDLLSDERTNRDVLHFIKRWDTAVFGKGADKLKKQQAGSPQRRGGSAFFSSAKKGGSFGGFSGGGYEAAPPPPVIILSGAAGAGKTTLAHVAGAHAGYRIVEINASDDRNAEKLVQKVKDAMAMQSVLGDRRPNLVVVDEIDGAVGGSNEGRNAIASLVKYIAQCAAVRLSGADSAASTALARPLICICNDVYAPALRPLRNLAKVFRMGALRPSRLTVRLNAICAAEKIAATKSALALLCKLCHGDVRACVNTLQILRSAAKGKIFRLTSAALESSTVAQRDHEASLFEQWEAIFREAKVVGSGALFAGGAEAKQRAAGSLGAAQHDTAGRGVGERSAMSAGALAAIEMYDSIAGSMLDKRLMAGVHENFLDVLGSSASGASRFAGGVEKRLRSSADVLHWMGDADLWMHRVETSQDYGLLKYVPCAIVATHLQCATSRAIRPRYPHDALRFDTQRTVNENIVRALIDSRSLKLTASSSRSVWRNATDMISPLLDIVAPANLAKSTRSNLLSADEKRELRTTAKVMADAGLTYAKADAASVRGWKNRAVLQQYVLEPAIDGLVGFHEQIHAARVEEAERAQKFANRRSKFDAPPSATASFDFEVERTQEARPQLPDAVRAHLHRAVAAEREGALRVARRAEDSAAAAKEAGERRELKEIALAARDRKRSVASAAAEEAPEAPKSGGFGFMRRGRQRKKRRVAEAVKAADVAKESGKAAVRAVTFRFQEGFTNAVRRKVVVADLL